MIKRIKGRDARQHDASVLLRWFCIRFFQVQALQQPLTGVQCRHDLKKNLKLAASCLKHSNHAIVKHCVNFFMEIIYCN